MSQRLTVAIGDAGPARAIKSGAVPIKGIEADLLDVNPIIGAYRRMVREQAYDIAEMAPTTYIIAKAHGAPFTALPIVLMRRFHHDGLVKHPDAGISTPADLRGKRVGVRAYSVTTGVWTRGILADEYGVLPGDVTWVVDDEEHVEAMRLPDNVIQAPRGRSLADMMAAGELDAAFTANAGIGRAGAPTAGWTAGATPVIAYEEVIADPQDAARRWYQRTGVYPIHAVVVVKDEVLKRMPELAGALIQAFEASKAAYLAHLVAGEGLDATDRRYLRDRQVVGPDPLPFGIAANASAIDMLIRYVGEQGLLPRPVSRDELFVGI